MKLNRKQYAIVVGNILAFVGLYFANKYFMKKEEDKRIVDENLGSIFVWGFGLSDGQNIEGMRGQFWSLKDRENQYPPKRVSLLEENIPMDEYTINKISENDEQIDYEFTKNEDGMVFATLKVFPQEERLEFNNLFKAR